MHLVDFLQGCIKNRTITKTKQNTTQHLSVSDGTADDFSKRILFQLLSLPLNELAQPLQRKEGL